MGAGVRAGLVAGQPVEAPRAALVDRIASVPAEQAGGALATHPEATRIRAELVAIAGRPTSQVARREAVPVVLAQRSSPLRLRDGGGIGLDRWIAGGGSA